MTASHARMLYRFQPLSEYSGMSAKLAASISRFLPAKSKSNSVAEAHAAFQKGMNASVSGNLEEAIAHFERALEFDPTNALSWRMLAVSHKRNGNSEAAEHATSQFNRLKSA